MVTVLTIIAAVWFALACAFVLALCLAARRKLPSPHTEQQVAVMERDLPEATEHRSQPERRRLWPKPWRARPAD